MSEELSSLISEKKRLLADRKSLDKTVEETNAEINELNKVGCLYLYSLRMHPPSLPLPFKSTNFNRLENYTIHRIKFCLRKAFLILKSNIVIQ